MKATTTKVNYDRPLVEGWLKAVDKYEAKKHLTYNSEGMDYAGCNAIDQRFYDRNMAIAELIRHLEKVDMALWSLAWRQYKKHRSAMETWIVKYWRTMLDNKV